MSCSYSRHVQLEVQPEAEKENAGGIIWPIWPGNALGLPSKSWRSSYGRKYWVLCIAKYLRGTDSKNSQLKGYSSIKWTCVGLVRWLFMVDSCLQRMAAVVHLSLHWLESMERITREVKVTFWLSLIKKKVTLQELKRQSCFVLSKCDTDS